MILAKELLVELKESQLQVLLQLLLLRFSKLESGEKAVVAAAAAAAALIATLPLLPAAKRGANMLLLKFLCLTMHLQAQEVRRSGPSLIWFCSSTTRCREKRRWTFPTSLCCGIRWWRRRESVILKPSCCQLMQR